MQPVSTQDISPNIKYSFVSYHRDGTKKKSQWTITKAEELICFQTAHDRAWLLPAKGWGLHFVDSEPDYLGVAQDHITRVLIAKFQENQGNWHGYPADYQRNNQDIPDISIQRKWIENGILPLQKIRKIGKKQLCFL